MSRVGLALSGGGFRATAFGLGALRALHDRDILSQIAVVSGISGGSLLAALWAYGPKDFDEFDQSMVHLLRTGLQGELLARAIRPRHAARSLGSAIGGVVPRRDRAFSRTEALVEALASRGLGVPMQAVSHKNLHTVISATDLATSNAVRFGSRASSSSPRGVIQDQVTVADAVAASAAFPLLLPALVRTYSFKQADDSVHSHTLHMTDGGVYDNLGITPLLPNRSTSFTSHVYELDHVVSVDAGVGRVERTPAKEFIGRLRQTLEISHGRVQDAGRNQLHSARSNGLQGFAHVYLGARDQLLPPVADLVMRDEVQRYPTNFAAISAMNFEALTVRGEQLTRVLLSRYAPNL